MFGRGKLNGSCQDGNKTVNTLSAVSTTKVQGSFPSCRVTVYLAGTVTPATLYSNSSGTGLANPFTAAATGQWGFYADDGAYDVQMDQGGIVTPFTISGFYLFDGTPFLASPSNSIPRGIKDKEADILSVKDFGAKGDGTTDDTTAINNAIAHSYAGTGSGASTNPAVCIYFPEGIYVTTAALSYNHTVCLTGWNYRIKYTGGGTIAAVLALIGDPSFPGPPNFTHAAFMEGSFIQGLVLDGQGHATSGLLLQGVISAQMNYLRATNVTYAGINCNWCQQVTFEHNQVSNNIENFSTTPQYGVVIDGISSANILHQANIEHVSADGIWLKYALNTLISGGTSEGNGGAGVRCDSSGGAGYQCFNNTIMQFDVEVNGTADFIFGAGSFFNSVIQANSSSTVGIVFSGDAHYNTIAGGAIGRSTASAGTYSNHIINVGSFALSDPVWTDSGSNMNTIIRNQSTGIVTQPRDNTALSHVFGHSAAALQVVNLRSLTDTHAGIIVGDPASDWLGFDCQSGLSCWMIYPNSLGMQFISETSVDTGAINDGAIKSHQWCIGRFCQIPLAGLSVDFFDQGSGHGTTVGIRAEAGQAGNDLLKIYDNTPTTPVLKSSIDSTYAFKGPVTARHAGQGVGTFSTLPTCTSGIEGRMEPISDSTTQVWGAPAAGGGSLHALIYCGAGGNWNVMAK